ncbi:MAG: cupin domain-containing protein [Terracidiphilus sp.]|jgi:mannose-6-phosphate isomerase-like protein (cupin superfamily)
MIRPIRRIITRNDEHGKSYGLADGPAENVIGGLTEIWMTGPDLPNQSSMDDLGLQSRKLYRPKGGTVFRYFQIPPASKTAHLSTAEQQKLWSDLFHAMDAADAQPDVRRDPGMHKTPSTDYIILLSGTITLVLDKTEHDLKPFDAVVQRGTNHAWVNRGIEDALLMAVLVSEEQR